MHLLAPLDGLRGAMLAGTPTRQVGAVKVFSTKRACPTCGTSYPELDPRMFSYNSKHGWCTTCVGTGLALTREQRKAYDDSIRDDDDKGREQSFPSEEAEVEGLVDEPCPDCAGTRLNPASRGVTFDGQSIACDRAVVGRPTRGAGSRRWRSTGRDAEIARDVVTEIKSRLEFLEEVGLGYLTLDRAAPTLVGRRGAAHPPRGAARQQPAGRLLRARRADDRPAPARQPDPARRAAASSRDKGNTLVVVEHDEDTIRRADHIIDIGPGAGKRGGRLVAEGSVDRAVGARRFGHRPLPRAPAASIRCSRAGRCCRRRPRPIARRAPPTRCSTIRGASLHNLQQLDVDVPLQAPGRGHRRQRLGQVDAGARRAAGQPAVHQHARRRGRTGRAARAIDGWRLDRPRARGRPDADRQDAALLPGDLHRLLGHDPQALRRDARGEGARLRAGALLLQHRRGPLPGLRRAGRAHDRDELPARREGAVRRLPRRSASTPRRWR